MSDNIKQITDQFEEIVTYYQSLLDQATKEKQEAQVQADLAKAKVRSLEAERDSLTESLRARGAKMSADTSTDAQRLSALTAERDNLQLALKNADKRIRELEAEFSLNKMKQSAAPEAAPASVKMPEPAPVEIPEPIAAEVPAEVPAPAEKPEPAAAEDSEPDFEEQKEMLRRMEEELARLEERLKRDS